MYATMRSRAVKLARALDRKIQHRNMPAGDFFWNFINTEDVQEIGQLDSSQRTLSIDWLIPSFSVGSGGHMTIFRMIKWLEEQGHSQRIFIVGPTEFLRGVDALKIINNYYIELSTPVFLSSLAAGDCDIAVATSWVTAYYLRGVPNVRGKFYFVQDFEPDFYAKGAEYYFAEHTYKFGFHGVTAGPWLATSLERDYGMHCDWFHLATDEVYMQNSEVVRSPNRLLFYARRATPRRAVELGLLAIQELNALRPDIEICLFGSEPFEVPFPATFLGVLNRQQLFKEYAKATVGMVLSSTNYSLIPNEMMATGLPVVELKTECTEMIYRDRQHLLLSEPSVSALTQSLLDLFSDEGLRVQLSAEGQKIARSWTWTLAGRELERAFRGVPK